MTWMIDGFRKDLDSRLDIAGWGLFCLLSGIVLLVPELPDGTWLTGTGAIVVAFAALRANLGLPVSRFWTILGAGFAALGIATLAGVALPWFAALMIVCGLGLMAEVLVGSSRQA